MHRVFEKYAAFDSDYFKQMIGAIHMQKKQRGRPVTVAKEDRLVPRSIRLSPKLWEKFDAWGGAAQLRTVLKASRVPTP